MPDAANYQLENLREALDIWELNEPASAARKEILTAVVNWALDRYVDPYQGAARVEGFPNLWRSRIPGTRHDGQMVFCVFWIEESRRAVRFDSFSTLSLPG
ncbi:hypothetical protein [Streptosporangium carneum]|uniref:Uncharacterized protein n=1 Tax=Streptosporangium carneum TaxID=47481 RepID=A0A9W6I7F8_9ACTN|nr:hypothetical protein [Streptosporangium carneum]GLK13471.1 hypothetical protein GCM10017600_68820 [Streptosporangium carneum]